MLVFGVKRSLAPFDMSLLDRGLSAAGSESHPNFPLLRPEPTAAAVAVTKTHKLRMPASTVLETFGRAKLLTDKLIGE